MIGLHRGHVLLRMGYGLGDGAQCTVLLRHVRHCRPELRITLSTFRDRFPLYHGLVDELDDQSDIRPRPSIYSKRLHLPWKNCLTCSVAVPSTPAERCLREHWGIEPTDALCRYQPLTVTPLAASWAVGQLAEIAEPPNVTCARWGVAVIHPCGLSWATSKRLDNEHLASLCDWLRGVGLVPLILDPERRTRALTGEHRLEKRCADVGQLGALLSRVRLFIGAASGPLFIAAMTGTPAIGVWLPPRGQKGDQHPLHSVHPSSSVVHLVSADHARALRGDREAGLQYFAAHHRHVVYRGDWLPVLKTTIEGGFDGTV